VELAYQKATLKSNTLLQREPPISFERPNIDRGPGEQLECMLGRQGI